MFDREGEAAQRLGLSPTRSPYDLAVHLIRGWVLFDPHGMFPVNLDGALAFFCEWAYAKSSRLPGQKILMIDEVWKFISTQRLPAELATCLQTGCKRGLAMIFNTQLPNWLHLAIRNECSEAVMFRLNDSSCLDFAVERGFDAAEIANAARSALRVAHGGRQRAARRAHAMTSTAWCFMPVSSVASFIRCLSAKSAR